MAFAFLDRRQGPLCASCRQHGKKIGNSRARLQIVQRFGVDLLDFDGRDLKFRGEGADDFLVRPAGSHGRPLSSLPSHPHNPSRGYPGVNSLPATPEHCCNSRGREIRLLGAAKCDERSARRQCKKPDTSSRQNRTTTAISSKNTRRSRATSRTSSSASCTLRSFSSRAWKRSARSNSARRSS